MTHILLVEDNDLNQAVIEDIFEFDEIPAELTCLGSGEEALEQVESIAPSLILMDVTLPGISGLETTRKLKENPATRDIVVWAITAHAMKGDGQKAAEAGCDQYVTKPVNIKDLADRIRTFLNEHQSLRSEPC